MSADWSDANVRRLRTWWSEGHTAATIAGMFDDGRSRNAIIGKAHKLGLPARNNRVGALFGRLPRVSRVQAEAQIAGSDANSDRPSHIRKGYASMGDDTTLSRFVKTGLPLSEAGPRQLALPSLARSAIEAGRSIFHRKGVKSVVDAGNVLVSGHSNVKIGRDVRKGPLRGYWIYTLSLEERATCPRSCAHWANCYGNHMPYAKRVDHRDAAALKAAIERDIKRLVAVRNRRGILVRLHALGDFFSVDYVLFWRIMLATYPTLAIYGYTARAPDDEIGRAVGAMNRAFPGRSMIRYSNGGRDQDCTVSIRKVVDAPVNSTICPEQTGKTAACATCGFCWHTRRNVAFLEH